MTLRFAYLALCATLRLLAGLATISSAKHRGSRMRHANRIAVRWRCLAASSHVLPVTSVDKRRH
jgi:hypothetical protein